MIRFTFWITLAIVGAVPAYGQVADKVFLGGSIVTVNDAKPFADAVAIKDGKILAVGSKEEIAKFQNAKTEIVDLAGRALLPGFVDGHGHCFGTGLQAASANLLAPPDYTITDIPGIIAELKKYAKSETAMKYGLILGFGYDEAQLKEQRPPNRHELDEVSKDIPVYIIHQSTHLGAGNTKALEIAGITAETKNPVGGVIRREKDGKTPDGVLEETIHYASLMKIMPKMGQAEFDGLAKAGMKLYAANGYRDSSNDVEFVSHKYRTPKYAVSITFLLHFFVWIKWKTLTDLPTLTRLLKDKVNWTHDSIRQRANSDTLRRCRN
jgi:predicted amidohydrolase YtcJ